MGAAGTVTAVLGSPPVSATWRRFRSGLRILAFHDVPDGDAFAAQLDLIGRHHRFVSGDEVAAARRGAELPGNAVWVTFDDGDPTVFRTALPILRERSVPATAYVCPGLVENGSAPWWEIVERAGERGLGATVRGERRRGPELVRALKTVPDVERRDVVTDLEAEAGGAPIDDRQPPSTIEDLRAWLDAGLELGNHTWDHPCLDRCEPDEQIDQIRRGHDRLTDLLGVAPTTFAYPNGDRTDVAARFLKELGYETVLLFDHRVARVSAGTAELSRLRLDAGADPNRTRAIVSGAHADLFGLTRGR